MVAGRLKLSAIPLFIIAGVLLGPGTPGPTIIEHSEGVGILSELGIVLLLFFGLANVYTSSRRQLVHEEDLRNATAVAQARLESLRHEYRYEDLPGLSGSDTTYVVGGRDFVVTHAVAGESPEDRATTVTVTVAWTANYNGTTQSRSVDCTTILGRSLD